MKSLDIILIAILSLMPIQNLFAKDQMSICKSEIYSEASKSLILTLNSKIIENKAFKLEKIEIDADLDNAYAVTIRLWNFGEEQPPIPNPLLQVIMVDSKSCKVKKIQFYLDHQ